MDMVLENITFSLPLDSYAGRDFIMWGQPEWIMKGHNAKGAVTHPLRESHDPPCRLQGTSCEAAARDSSASIKKVLLYLAGEQLGTRRSEALC